MTTVNDTETAIQLKVRELCETIVAQPEFSRIRERVDAFMADDASKSLYQTVVEQGDTLNQKQHAGEALDETAVAGFERDRQALFGNPIAKGFLDAQEEIHNITQSVNRSVSKTFELGRLPTPEDLNEGGCGEGCGCHH